MTLVIDLSPIADTLSEESRKHLLEQGMFLR